MLAKSCNTQSVGPWNGNGNSLDKLRHPRFDAYSAEQVLLNKQQIWCGGAYLDCYHGNSCALFLALLFKWGRHSIVCL